uniref:Uncharacterized protein n=1 Tax=Rhizophora mucronata TaxID=61149 RepID=A0A2P2JH27_RHIMU
MITGTVLPFFFNWLHHISYSVESWKLCYILPLVSNFSLRIIWFSCWHNECEPIILKFGRIF